MIKETGIILRQERESRNIDIETVAKELRINAKYIEMIEAGSLPEASKEIYVAGYIKSYAKWLGIEREIAKTAPTKTKVDRRIKSQNTDRKLSNLSLRVNYKLFLASISVALLIFGATILTLSSKTTHLLDSSEHSNKYKFLLIAQDSVKLDVYDYNGVKVDEKTLKSGDVYFLDMDKNLVFSKKMHLIDVFDNNESGEFVSNLEKLTALHNNVY